MIARPRARKFDRGFARNLTVMSFLFPLHVRSMHARPTAVGHSSNFTLDMDGECMIHDKSCGPSGTYMDRCHGVDVWERFMLAS